jgi:hypothetical protein
MIYGWTWQFHQMQWLANVLKCFFLMCVSICSNASNYAEHGRFECDNSNCESFAFAIFFRDLKAPTKAFHWLTPLWNGKEISWVVLALRAVVGDIRQSTALKALEWGQVWAVWARDVSLRWYGAMSMRDISWQADASSRNVEKIAILLPIGSFQTIVQQLDCIPLMALPHAESHCYRMVSIRDGTVI